MTDRPRRRPAPKTTSDAFDVNSEEKVGTEKGVVDATISGEIDNDAKTGTETENIADKTENVSVTATANSEVKEITKTKKKVESSEEESVEDESSSDDSSEEGSSEEEVSTEKAPVKKPAAKATKKPAAKATKKPAAKAGKKSVAKKADVVVERKFKLLVDKIVSEKGTADVHSSKNLTKTKYTGETPVGIAKQIFEFMCAMPENKGKACQIVFTIEEMNIENAKPFRYRGILSKKNDELVPQVKRVFEKKKAAPKTPVAKKPAAKKEAPKKATTKKTTTKKVESSEEESEEESEDESSESEESEEEKTTKKSSKAVKKAPAKKPAAKKAPAKKAPAKKASAKKTAKK
jgi:hypothetical protein